MSTTIQPTALAAVILMLHSQLAPQSSNAGIIQSEVTLRVDVIAQGSPTVSQSLSVPNTGSPVGTGVLTNVSIGKLATGSGRAASSLTGGTAAFEGSYDKQSQPNSGGFVGSEGTITHDFTTDQTTTFLFEGTAATVGGGSAMLLPPAPPSVVISEGTSPIPIYQSVGPLNGLFSGKYILDPGEYTLVLKGVDTLNVSWAFSIDAEAQHRTVFNWGFDALPGATPDSPILPTLIGPDFFEFDAIASVSPLFYDPEIAVGYDYSTDEIPFASVEIPGALPNGDDVFELIVGGESFVLSAGQVFDFTSLSTLGVSEFSIRGIDVGEGLNPADPLAFVTGLSFVEDGVPTSFRMTPVSQAAEVPEPSSFALLGIGITSLCGLGWHRKLQQAA